MGKTAAETTRIGIACIAEIAGRAAPVVTSVPAVGGRVGYTRIVVGRTTYEIDDTDGDTLPRDEAAVTAIARELMRKHL